MKAHITSALLVAGLSTATLTGFASTSAAQAPDTDERTKVTIDEPVEVPHATLQPGAYWFELVSSKADQNTVTIRNEEENKMIATVITVPIFRDLNDTHGDTELVLSRSAGEGVAALDAWFFPGKQYGHQFVYPKDQAAKIAERTKHVVLADADGKVMRLNPGGISEPWEPDTKHAQPLVADNDAKSSDADRAGMNADRKPAGAAKSPAAVGTSGMADHASMSADQHLEALERLIDDALKGNGSTLSIDRSTLQEMRTHVQQLQSTDKK
jgi:hypothetical protein